jgi:hypothetical protein
VSECSQYVIGIFKIINHSLKNKDFEIMYRIQKTCMQQNLGNPILFFIGFLHIIYNRGSQPFKIMGHTHTFLLAHRP